MHTEPGRLALRLDGDAAHEIGLPCVSRGGQARIQSGVQMRMPEPSKARSARRRPLVRCSKYAVPLAAVLVLAIASAASAFVISHASSRIVQKQPMPGSCHVRGHYPFTMP